MQHDDSWALDEHGVWRKRREKGAWRKRLRSQQKLSVPKMSRKGRDVKQDATPRARRKLGRSGRLGVAGAVGLAAVLIILAVAGVFGSNKPPGGFEPTATKPARAARQTAEAFLSAWKAGHFRKAGSYTNHPAAAAAALASYRDGLHLRALHLAVHSATAKGKVAFSVGATVGVPAAPTTAAAVSSGSSAASRDAKVTATWSYTSDLTTYAKHGAWWVRWSPGLVAPGLTAAEKVVSARVAPDAAEVVDTAGRNLQNSSDPGLVNIAAALTKNPPAFLGSPGVDVMFVGSRNRPVPGSTQTLRPPSDGVVKTTISPRVERAAESAVQAHADSALVVIQPSTGKILAIANNDGGNDFALTARVAPGSTNKIITSTALFTTGLVRSPRQPVECPPQVDANGEVFNNAGGESEPPGTPFLIDFAASCNNAFDRWYASLGPHTLARTAQKYYGLNEPWNIGIGERSRYYTIPPSASKNELALELFGQGRLATAPLAMASVAATVDNGSFKQPIVVPGQPQLAATPLPATVRHYLWQMMRAVTQGGGTAAGVFDGVTSAVYAKTGTADVGGQSQPNSWLVAFDPTLHVAVGCVVLDAGYGAQVAGPEVATVLRLLSRG